MPRRSTRRHLCPAWDRDGPPRPPLAFFREFGRTATRHRRCGRAAPADPKKRRLEWIMRFDSGLLGHNGDVSIYPPIDEWAETLRILESCGYGGVWSAEHHFFWDGWTNPVPTNPVMFGAFAAAQTKRLKLGQCGVCLPDWHPIRVAEDVAMLDHMSRGR